MHRRRKGEAPDEAAKARLEACVEEAVVMTDEFMCWKTGKNWPF